VVQPGAVLQTISGRIREKILVMGPERIKVGIGERLINEPNVGKRLQERARTELAFLDAPSGAIVRSRMQHESQLY
jgi:hypothetical protein